jgi:hypothetical protein
MTNRFGIYLCRGSCCIKEFVGGQLALSWRRCRPCLAYLTGAALIEGEYALFPGAVAAQPASSLREPSPGIRASLLTQAKFFRHARSCRSPRGDTQLLRLSAILASTFYPPGHCYAY